MTFEERYQELHDLTEGFKNRSMIKHHLIRHFKAVADQVKKEIIIEQEKEDQS